MSEYPKQDAWQPPPELQHALPRPVRMTPAGVALAFFGALFLFGAFAIGWIADDQGRVWTRVEQEGVTTGAIVTRLWVGGGKNHTRMVSYRFRAASAEIAGKSSMG